jgi:hypothetical protein
MQGCAKLVRYAVKCMSIAKLKKGLNVYLEMNMLFALSARIIRRFKTADKIMTPKKQE